MQKNSNNISLLHHYPQLDGLRAVAIFLVLITHFFGINETNLLLSHPLIGPILTKLASFGKEGVVLFFILSGYLISKILIYSKSSSNYFSSFFIRRFLRIFPLYYLVLILSFFIFPLFFDVPKEAARIIQEQWRLWLYLSNAQFLTAVPWDISLYPNFGHFWTLSVEEHFYLLWPFLVYFIPTNRLNIWMWAVLVLSLSSWILGEYISFFHWTTLTNASSLALGGLIAYYQVSHKNYFIQYTKWIEKYKYLYIVILLIAIFLPRNLGFLRDFSVYIFSLFIFSALVLVTVENRILFLNSKILIFIGKISYGIYVYHALLRPFFIKPFYEVPIKLYGINNSLIITIMYTVVSSTLSIIIAWISWELFEKKILYFKKYFPYNNR